MYRTETHRHFAIGAVALIALASLFALIPSEESDGATDLGFYTSIDMSGGSEDEYYLGVNISNSGLVKGNYDKTIYVLAGGGILLITEGVYGMTGALGILDQIVALKKKYNFRILIDDAHGFGVMGEHGRGTSEHFGVMDGVDLYIGAYAKSMASIGGFVAGPKVIIDYLRYNLRSQIYAKSLPMAFVEGGLKRLEIIRSAEGDELRKKLFTVTRALQNGFRELGFDIGPAEACVTPVAIKGGVGQATKMAVDLRENYGIFCSIVIYPVIPKGMIIFRVIPTAAHSMEDVEYTLKTFAEIRAKLERGEYDGDDIVDMAIH